MNVTRTLCFASAVGVVVATGFVACGSDNSSDAGSSSSGSSSSSGGSSSGGSSSGGSSSGGSSSGGSSSGGSSSGASSSGDGGGSDTGASDAGSTRFDYLVVILMENHGYSEIYGHATFMTQHADANASLRKYTAIDHPSEPNYLAMFCGLAGDCNNAGGATGGCMTGGGDSTSDCASRPGGACSMGGTKNLVDLLEGKGLSWHAWNENASKACDIGAGNVRHVPFLYFDDITNNANRCNRVTTSTPGSDQELVDALGSTATASNFMWLTPDDDHDMHNNSVASGDAYLGALVPKILGSQVFKTQKAALFIVFDEGPDATTYPNDYLYSVWAGPVVKTNFVSTTAYSHYSPLATIEANWGLPSLTDNDKKATPMMEVFK